MAAHLVLGCGRTFFPAPAPRARVRRTHVTDVEQESGRKAYFPSISLFSRSSASSVATSSERASVT